MITTIKKTVLKTNFANTPYRIEKRIQKVDGETIKRFFLLEGEAKETVYTTDSFGDCCYFMFNRSAHIAMENEKQLTLTG